jgi:hypothetical protein
MRADRIESLADYAASVLAGKIGAILHSCAQPHADRSRRLELRKTRTASRAPLCSGGSAFGLSVTDAV